MDGEVKDRDLHIGAVMKPRLEKFSVRRASSKFSPADRTVLSGDIKLPTLIKGGRRTHYKKGPLKAGASQIKFDSGVLT